MSELEEARKALIQSFVAAIGLKPGKPPTGREMLLMSYSDDTKVLIARAIELDPALTEPILAIAEHAYADGVDSVD